MAGRKNAATAKTAAQTPSAPLPERDQLSDKQLAKAVLAGDLRPRAAEVRRLAEAVLKKAAPKTAKKPKGKGKKPKSDKLARIPQKKK